MQTVTRNPKTVWTKTQTKTASKKSYTVSSTSRPIIQDDGKLPLTEQNKIKWEMRVDGKYIGTVTMTADRDEYEAVQKIVARCPKNITLPDAPFIELTAKTVGRRAHLAPVGLVEVRDIKWQVGK